MDISKAYNLIVSKLESWLDAAIVMLPNLVVAVIIFIIFYVAGRIIRKIVSRLLGRVTKNKSVINLFETIVGISIVAIGFFIALGILQLDDAVTSLLAGAGIIGLAIGIAFQDIVSNFIAGIILSIRNPFNVGDIIQSNDYYGLVREINLRTTILYTLQGQNVYIPNKMVFDNPLENFSQNGERRIDLECGVSYGDDLEKARKAALEAIEGLENYDKGKKIDFFYHEFGESSINFELRFWIKFRTNRDFWDARSEAIIALTQKFDEYDIMIPFPIRTLDFGIRGGENLKTMINGDTKQGNLNQDAAT